MQILHVAEKNSVAKEIAFHLSGGRSRTGRTLSKFNPVFQFPSADDPSVQMIVTSVRGHVFEYYFPEEFKVWHRHNPKILLNQVQIIKKPNPQMDDLVKNLENLARASSRLVLWLDCDREGEAIAYEVIEICRRVRSSLVIRRAQFSAVTRRDVLNAYNNLRDPKKEEADAVQYRREIDFRLGCCFTRFQTLAYQDNFPQKQGPVTYGPCQFPTLGFVVQRYLKVVNFKPQKFWQIKCHYVDQDNKKLSFKWKRNRLFDEEAANLLFVEIFESFSDNRPKAKVLSQMPEKRKRFKPYPLATITLQKLGTQKLRMSSDQVMDHAEKLYQKGILSYPRTETNAYPPTMNLRSIVELFERSDGEFGQYARKLLREGGFSEPRKGNKNDNAHPPIHPVRAATKEDMTADQWKVYDLICRHFLGSCSKDAEGDEVVTEVQVADEMFNSKHLKVTAYNYLQIYTFDKWTESDLPPDLPLQFQAELQLYQSQTTPPTYLTETELITLMDKNQIGTDSTIHEHIKTILTRNFAVKTNQTIKPTKLGLALVQTYNEMEIEFAKCDIRRNIQQTMNMIAQRKLTKQRAVVATISVMIPLYDKLEQHRNMWVTLMRKHMPGMSVRGVNQQLDVGTCGICSETLTYDAETVSIKCQSCSSNYTLPFGNITSTEELCPICHFTCLRIENPKGRNRNICPKCYNSPDPEWSGGLANLECAKCKFNCKFARGVQSSGIFPCGQCQNRAGVKMGKFVGCMSWPSCKWTRSLKSCVKDVRVTTVNCPICLEERNCQSSLCEVDIDETKVEIDDYELSLKVIESKDIPQRKKEILTFCLNPSCSCLLYKKEWESKRKYEEIDLNSRMDSRSLADSRTESQFDSRSINQDSRIPKKADFVCYKCNQPGHVSTNCPNKHGNSVSSANQCYNCGQTGHFANNCKKPKANKQKQTKELICYKCNKPGHSSRQCGAIVRSNSIQDGDKYVCFNCNKPGHFATNCPGKGGKKKACGMCGQVGRHPKGSTCAAIKRKKDKTDAMEQEQF